MNIPKGAPPINHTGRGHLSRVPLMSRRRNNETPTQLLYASREIPNVSSATDKPQRVTGNGQHIGCIMVQACSQAHDGCLEHFVFCIGLKGNHNSNMANITSSKRPLPYKKLWPLPGTPGLELLQFVTASW